MKKKISRKLVMSYVCIAITVVLQIIGSFTHTDTSVAMVIVATATGIYSVSNVLQKINIKRDDNDDPDD